MANNNSQMPNPCRIVATKRCMEYPQISPDIQGVKTRSRPLLDQPAKLSRPTGYATRINCDSVALRSSCGRSVTKLYSNRCAGWSSNGMRDPHPDICQGVGEDNVRRIHSLAHPSGEHKSGEQLSVGDNFCPVAKHLSLDREFSQRVLAPNGQQGVRVGRAKVGLSGFRSTGDFVYGDSLAQLDPRARDLSYAGEVVDRKMGDRKMKARIQYPFSCPPSSCPSPPVRQA